MRGVKSRACGIDRVGATELMLESGDRSKG